MFPTFAFQKPLPKRKATLYTTRRLRGTAGNYYSLYFRSRKPCSSIIRGAALLGDRSLHQSQGVSMPETTYFSRVSCPSIRENVWALRSLFWRAARLPRATFPLALLKEGRRST
jgi:hypothetical protein